MRRWRVAGALVGAAVVGVGSLMMVEAQAASPTYSASLERAPYLTDVTQTTAEVNWGTNIKSTAGSVQYIDETAGGTCSTSPWTWTTGRPTALASTQIPYGTGTTGWGYSVGSTSEYQNSAQLTGLTAGHTYCYAVFSTKTKSGLPLLTSPAYQSFTTLLPASASSTATVSFDVIGDTGENFAQTGTNGSGGTVSTPFPSGDSSGVENQNESNLYSEIGHDQATGQARFLLGAGDTSYNGGSEDTLGDLHQPGTLAEAQGTGATEYSNIFGPTYLPLAGGIPSYISDGNHGQNSNALKAFPAQASAGASGGTYAYDAYPASGQPEIDGIKTSSPDDWYAFSTGNVRIYVLDAAWGDDSIGTAGSQYQADADEHWQASSPEMEWLKKDLSNSTYSGMIKLAVFHYPLTSINNSQPSDTYLDTQLEPVLKAGGVSIVFNGHAHTYQRFYPNGGGQVDYVTGGGGGVPEPVDGNGDTKGACAAEKAVASVYAIGWSPTTALGGSPQTAGSACGSATPPTDWGGAYNYLHVTVAGNQVSVNGVNADDVAFDPETYTVTNGVATLGGGGSPPPTSTTTSTSTSTTSTTSTTQGSGGISPVQNATSTTKTVTLPGPTKAGDTLVLSAALDTGATNHITAISGTGLNWNLAVDAHSSGHDSDGEIWYASNVPAGITSVTITTAVGTTALDLQEFSGLGTAPTVVASGNSSTSTSASQSQSGTGLAVGFVTGNGSSQAITPVSGWTSQGQVTAGTSNLTSLVEGYEPTTGSATYGGSWATAMYFAVGVAVFTPG